MDIADLGRLGFLPLQDHAKKGKDDLNLARTLFGVRLLDRDSQGRYVPDQQSAGDVVGAVYAKATNDRARRLGSWSFAMPVLAGDPPVHEDLASAATVVRGEPDDAWRQPFKPVKSVSGVTLDVYDAFEDTRANLLGHGRAVPKGTPGLMVNTLKEDKQIPIVLTGGPLVAVNQKAAEVNAATLVAELKEDSSVDTDRQARLHSLLRVAVIQDPVVPAGPGGAVLAMNFGTSGGKDHVAGLGLFCHAPFAGNGNSDLALPQATPAGDGISTAIRLPGAVPGSQIRTGPPPSVGLGGLQGAINLSDNVFGVLSAQRGGPLTAGNGSCRHHLTNTKDLEPVNVGHVSTDAAFWKTSALDGPVNFESQPYSNPAPGPVRIPGHLRFDPGATYVLPTLKDGGKRQYAGQWRVEVDSWTKPEDKPPPVGDTFPPPPAGPDTGGGPVSSGGRTPTGQSGTPRGGGRTDNGTGEGSGTGFGGDGRKGFHPHPGTPPPVGGGGVRGSGSGDDGGWKPTPYGYHPEPVGAGYGTGAPYVPIPTDDVGAFIDALHGLDGTFGGIYGGGPSSLGFGGDKTIYSGNQVIPVAALNSRLGRALNSGIDVAALPPVLANPYPPTARGIGGDILFDQITFRGNPSNPLAIDSGRTPTRDPFLDAQRPETGGMVGFAQGTGFDGGWVYKKPPGSSGGRTPTSAGGIAPLPPGNTVGDLLGNKLNCSGQPAAFLLPSDCMKLFMGMPNSVGVLNRGFETVHSSQDNTIETVVRSNGTPTPLKTLTSGGTETWRSSGAVHTVLNNGRVRVKQNSGAGLSNTPTGYVEIFYDSDTGHVSRIGPSGGVVDLETGGGGGGSGTVNLAIDPLELITTSTTDDTVQIKDQAEGTMLVRLTGTGTGPPSFQTFADWLAAEAPGGLGGAGGRLYKDDSSGGDPVTINVPMADQLVDGESFHIYAWGTASTGITDIEFDGDVLASNNVVLGTPPFSIHAVIKRVGAATVFTAWFDSDGGTTLNTGTLASFFGDLVVNAGGGGTVLAVEIWRSGVAAGGGGGGSPSSSDGKYLGPGPEPAIWHDALVESGQRTDGSLVGTPGIPSQAWFFPSSSSAPETYWLACGGGANVSPTFRRDVDGTGYPGWDFLGAANSVAEHTISSTAPNDYAGELLAVFRADSVAANQYVCGFIDDTGVGAAFLLLAINSSGNPYLWWFKAGGTAQMLTGGSTLATGTTYVYRVQSDGATTRMWINGVEETLTPDTGSNTGGWNMAANHWSLGSVHTSTFGYVGLFNGKIFEARYYSGVYTDDDTGAALDAFLMDKWGA